jgi:hypothetical protein
MRPQADAIFKKRLASEGKDQPAAYCKPDRAPAINSAPLPFKIVQTPKPALARRDGASEHVGAAGDRAVPPAGRGGHLTIATTIDDPGAYTKPFKYTETLTLQTDSDLLECYCTENEKDVQHYQ